MRYITTILIVASVVTIFRWLTRVPPMPRRSRAKSNDQLLNESIDRVVSVLHKHERADWAENLLSAKARLNMRGRRDETLQELASYFGGMGSLNDTGICDENEHFDKLLDDLFKNVKLADATQADRDLWTRLEIQHKDDLPPRIRNSFRGTEEQGTQPAH